MDEAEERSGSLGLPAQGSVCCTPGSSIRVGMKVSCPPDRRKCQPEDRARREAGSEGCMPPLEQHPAEIEGVSEPAGRLYQAAVPREEWTAGGVVGEAGAYGLVSGALIRPYQSALVDRHLRVTRNWPDCPCWWSR